MHKFFAEMRGATTVEALWKAVSDYFEARGIDHLTAVHLPPLGAPDGQQELVHIQGYPEELIARYHARYRDDPIPDHIRINPWPFRWSDVAKLPTLTDEQIAFLAECAELGIVDGVAIPVFGPHGRNGYFGIGLPDDQRDVSEESVRDYQIVAQMAHQRLCEMLEPDDCDQIRLSPRERETLEWVARGKSNASIAEILGISTYTVDTHLRRTYGKLDVTDRVRAAIRGIGCGLISP